jgi:hypothetical protein
VAAMAEIDRLQADPRPWRVHEPEPAAVNRSPEIQQKPVRTAQRAREQRPAGRRRSSSRPAASSGDDSSDSEPPAPPRRCSGRRVTVDRHYVVLTIEDELDAGLGRALELDDERDDRQRQRLERAA